MNFVKPFSIAAAAALMLVVGTAHAQDSSYTPNTVWQVSNIQVEPGQFERYIDYLSGDWKRVNEFGKKEGYVVSYHVFAVNNKRGSDPDLILAVEYKDYYGNADRLAQQKRVEAFLAGDSHKLDSAFGERKVLRKIVGAMELQELKLK